MEEIINNIMQSPENTNPNVLRSQLQNIGGISGGAVYATFTKVGDTYTCDKTYDELKTAYDSGSIIFGAFQDSVFPMLFVTDVSGSGFGGTIMSASGRSSINALHYYRFGVLNDGTIFGSEIIKEFST